MNLYKTGVCTVPVPIFEGTLRLEVFTKLSASWLVLLETPNALKMPGSANYANMLVFGEFYR